MTESEELAIRKDRVRRARKAADYSSQAKMAEAMSKMLGEGFSLKMYRHVEDGKRDLTIREARAFMYLTGATLEFLTGQTSTIDISEAKGVWLASWQRKGQISFDLEESAIAAA